MSQSSNSSNNTDASSKASGVTVRKEETNTQVMDRTPKRGVSEEIDDHVKKIKVERGSSDENSSKVVPRFQLASQILANQSRTTLEVVPEISDDELLAMAIEFEKKHPQCI